MSAKTSKQTQSRVPEPEKQAEVPEFSAKGEPRRNWHRQSLRLVDELILKRKIQPGLETTLLLVIQRFTWGAERKPEYFHASGSQLARLCGVTRQAIEVPLKRLESAKLIASIDGDAGAQPRSDARFRGYRATPEHWHAAKPCESPLPEGADKKKGLPPSEPASAAFADPKTVLVVLPGRNSRPMPLHLALKGKPELECPIRFFGGEDVTMGLAFAPVSTPAGIDVYFRRVAAESEGKANPGASPLALSPPLKQPKSLKTNKLVSSRLHTYRAFLEPVFLARLQKPVDKLYLENLYAATQGAPVERLAAKVAELVKRRTFTSGVLLTAAAEDIGPAWAASRQEELDLEAYPAWLRHRSPTERAEYREGIRRFAASDPAAFEDAAAADPGLRVLAAADAKEAASHA